MKNLDTKVKNVSGHRRKPSAVPMSMSALQATSETREKRALKHDNPTGSVLLALERTILLGRHTTTQ